MLILFRNINWMAVAIDTAKEAEKNLCIPKKPMLKPVSFQGKKDSLSMESAGRAGLLEKGNRGGIRAFDLGSFP